MTILACFMCPFGEIIAGGGGALLGIAIMAKLCWRYLKAKWTGKTCKCDCCHHHHDR